MSSGILTVMKKELARFFGDKRTMVTLLLPGLIVYVLYSFMGSAMGSMFGVDEGDEGYVHTIQAQALPVSVAALFEGSDIAVEEATSLEAAKEAVTAQELELLLVFPEDFDRAVAAYEPVSGTPAPLVEIYYNSASTNSTVTYQMITGLLDAYESQMANKFDINIGGGSYDLATEADSTGSYFAMLLPMLLMTFLYSGCSAVAPESIAGEKERGTIATMLITPIRRGHIAMGKILALAVLSMLSAASSTVGTILAIPKMMGMGGAGLEMDASIYGITDYLVLAAVILSTVLVLVTITAILSAFAKTIKEAQTYAMPLMILVMVVGVTGMFGNASQELGSYLIPLYNSVQCMVGIFSFNALAAGVAVTLVVNMAVTVVGALLLARMFNSEKIIFSR